MCLFGAAPDTGNQGVTALCYAAINELDRRGLGPVSVFDHGRGRRSARLVLPDRVVRFARIGAVSGRRYYRPENLWHMRLASRAGGLWSAGARAVAAAGAVLDVSGGDSFAEIYGPRRLQTVVAPKLMALELGKPLLLLPQTYGPFHTGRARERARRIVRAATAAWARDAASFDELTSLLGDAFDPQRHRCGVDMAFALPATPPRRVPSPAVRRWLDQPHDGSPLVGFNVSGLLYNRPGDASRQFGLRTDYREAVVGILRELLARSGARVLLVPHVRVAGLESECDEAACEDLRRRLGAYRDRVDVVRGAHDACELKWIIARADWFCGTRMHATIAGLSSGVPTTALAYSMKTQGVFETCSQGERVADLRRLDASELIARVFRDFSQRDAQRESLHRNLPGLRRRAEEQMDDIAQLLGRASTPLEHAA